MRRIGEIMEDLGFNKEGSVETQKAFIKHLIKAAQVSQIDRKSKPLPKEPEQLSFDLQDDNNNVASPTPPNTKAVS